MRDAVPFLNDLKERFDLEYTALIDLEPASMENGAKTIYTGSVGKTMPAVLVQGVKAQCIKLFPGCQLCRSFKQLFHENRTGTGICRKKVLRKSAHRQPGFVFVTGKKATMCPCLSGWWIHEHAWV